MSKSGWKSTEFWVTVLTLGATLAGALAGTLPPGYAVIASAIASGLYATSRGLSKSGT